MDAPHDDNSDPGLAASDERALRRHLRAIAEPPLEPTFGSRLERLDAVIADAAAKQLGAPPMMLRPSPVRLVVRWMSRAAVVGLAAGLGLVAGWEPRSESALASHVVVDRGVEHAPVTVMDAHAVARLLATAGGRPITLESLDLPRGVGRRLDADGNGVLEGADVELLLDRIVSHREDSP